WHSHPKANFSYGMLLASRVNSHSADLGSRTWLGLPPNAPRYASASALPGPCNSSFIKTPVKPCVGPRAEDAANYYAIGLDVDLNVAMKIAVRETVELLQEKAGLTAAEAYSVASLGVDFRIAEAVDSVQLIYGTIPKKFFKRNPDYWTNKQSPAVRWGGARSPESDESEEWLYLCNRFSGTIRSRLSRSMIRKGNSPSGRERRGRKADN